MNTVLLLVTAYLLGALPIGYWVVKYTRGIDLLTVGSGSTGTTNVLRTAGKGAAALVFFLDNLKGFIPTYLAVYCARNGLLPEIGNSMWIVCAVAMICIVAHSKSIFLKFKGGKGAATALGTTFAMNWMGSLTSFGLFVLLVYLFKFVSLASLIAVGTSCIVMWLYSHEPSFTGFCLFAGVFVVYSHRANIRRLLAGTEPKIGQRVQATPKMQ
ncbi:MAG TPA: glycerol-3-phosphate 1-O-acyltransferase PlsY [Drouetiella sp.]|jgi:acyl phosphate:glycerol-3-phosphate acyltransferase